MSKNHHSSPFPSCFRPTNIDSAARALPPPPPPPPPFSCNPNLITSLYSTDLGLFALTWSRNLFGRSLHLHFLLDDSSAATEDGDGALSFPSLSTPCFHLHIKPLVFWNKQGSKKLNINSKSSKKAYVFWDLSKARFGSGPEPRSGFFIAIVIDGEMTLLVGDFYKEAYAKTRAREPETEQVLMLRREHVYGSKLYTTKADFGGKERNISIDCRLGDDPRLYFSIDNRRVLQIKHLKWKFRGNERIEVDGISVQVSWDVYNRLFEDEDDGYALFMFRFERQGSEDEDDYCFSHCSEEKNVNGNGNGMVLWSKQTCGFGFEAKMMKKGLLRKARSASSSSLSSASSSCSSVMEWASMEENELKGPSGFSLLVYAWKS